MAIILNKVEARNRLEPRNSPYWQRLSEGAYLGFRKQKTSSSGTWLVRYRDKGLDRQLQKPLGALDHLPPSERFDTARKKAQEWLEHLEHGGSTEVVSTKDACALYVKHVRNDSKRRSTTAGDLEGRYRRWVYSQPLGAIELTKLTKSHVRAWRETLVSSPVIANKTGQSRDRSPASVNRDMTALRAALNFAKSEGWVTSDAAWATPLRPIEGANNRRNTYLTLDERAKLVDCADSEIKAFLKGMALLPLRPGALAKLIVSDFCPETAVLRVTKDKTNSHRHIQLPEEAADLLRTCAAGKSPLAPLISRSAGKAWNKDAWKKPVRQAAAAAGLSKSVTTYTLRHSVITDLVKTHGLDLLTTAQLAGTSVAMIEKHYGHLLPSHALNALSGLSLRQSQRSALP